MSADADVPAHTLSCENLAIPYEAGGRATVTIGLLVAGIVLAAVSIWSNYQQIQLLERAKGGETIAVEEELANDRRQQAIAWLSWAAYGLTAIAFSMWIHRAHRNLPALGACGLEYTPVWAVAGFFIPFACFYMPYRAMVEIWNASSEGPSTSGYEWRSLRGPALVKVWWGTWLLINIAANFASMAGTTPRAVEDFVIGSWSAIYGEGAWVVASLLAIAVVRGIHRRQEESFERLQAAAGLSPYGF